MKHLPQQPCAWMLSAAIQVTGLVGALFVGAQASPLSVAEMPGTAAPTSSESLAMIVAATGVQIHECRPDGGPAPATPCAQDAAGAAERVDDRSDEPLFTHR